MIPVPQSVASVAGPPPRLRTPAGGSGRVGPLFLLLVAAACLCPRPAAAQSFSELLNVIRRGGGWIAVPVDDGRGTLQSASVPTGGLRMEGCARVWSGHSGSWRVRAEDVVSERVLEATMDPGEAVTFEHEAGSRARIRLDVSWSEPRDTTFLLWVGLGARSDERDPCTPAR